MRCQTVHKKITLREECILTSVNRVLFSDLLGILKITKLFSNFECGGFCSTSMHAPLLKHWRRTHEICATQVQLTHLSRHTTKREMIGNGIFVNASLLLNDQQISKT